MAVGDKMVLTLSSRWTAQTVGLNALENVFAYEVVSGTGDTADLSDTFIASIMPVLDDVISAGYEFYQTYTINLDNPADFDLTPMSVPGVISGDYYPPFVGWEFRYLRSTRAINDGRKTFAGIPEDAVAGGVPNGAALTDLGQLATALNNQLTGANGSYAPRIWRRAGSYGTPPVVFPDTFYPIVGVTFQRISTQNTRKR